MAFYKKQYNSKTGVWFPLAVTVGKPVETKEIAERLALISTVSKADVAAVLADLAQVMADYLKQGKSVRLDGLGTFRYTIASDGVKDEKDFDLQKQVKAVRVQFTPAREGGTTRGDSATRSLVPGTIEWLPWQGTDTDAGSGGGGGEDPEPLG